MQPHFLTMKQAAEFLGMGYSSFYEHQLHKTLPRVKTPWGDRIKMSDLVEYAQGVERDAAREAERAKRMAEKL